MKSKRWTLPEFVRISIVTMLLLALLVIGTPVAFALAIAGAVGLYSLGGASMLLGILDTAPLSAASSSSVVGWSR